MTTTQQGLARAIAWQLRMDSVSGGKVYSVCVLNKDVVIAWGSEAQTLTTRPAGTQAKVHHFHNMDAAMQFAKSQTALKEAKGYGLNVAPRVYTCSEGEFLSPCLQSVHTVLWRGEKM